MSDENVVRTRLEDKGRGRTDWERVDALTDEEIERAVAEDPDAAPLLDEEFWRAAELTLPPEGEKEQISIRLDEEIVDYFKRGGSGYQTRINAVLRAYVRSRERQGV